MLAFHSTDGISMLGEVGIVGNTAPTTSGKQDTRAGVALAQPAMFEALNLNIAA